MQLQEQVAADLRRATVLICTSPARSGGSYGGGVGTVIGSRYVVTTKHVAEISKSSPIYIWHPEDELQMNFRPRNLYTKGENTIIETDKSLPFPTYPITGKNVDDVMKPGATILYPGGNEFYTMIEAYQMPINIGTYNGLRGPNQYLGQGRLDHGTSGAGVVSLEDQCLVGILFGNVPPTETRQNISFRGTSNLSATLHSLGIETATPATTTKKSMSEAVVPTIQNKYLRWGVLALAGIGGTLIVKKLL